ncbi:MAG: hypothetical protein AAGB51_06270 [Planctomycetota bacterium]
MADLVYTSALDSDGLARGFSEQERLAERHARRMEQNIQREADALDRRDTERARFAEQTRRDQERRERERFRAEEQRDRERGERRRRIQEGTAQAAVAAGIAIVGAFNLGADALDAYESRFPGLSSQTEKLREQWDDINVAIGREVVGAIEGLGTTTDRILPRIRDGIGDLTDSLAIGLFGADRSEVDAANAARLRSERIAERSAQTRRFTDLRLRQDLDLARRGGDEDEAARIEAQLYRRGFNQELAGAGLDGEQRDRLRAGADQIEGQIRSAPERRRNQEAARRAAEEAQRRAERQERESRRAAERAAQDAERREVRGRDLVEGLDAQRERLRIQDLETRGLERQAELARIRLEIETERTRIMRQDLTAEDRATALQALDGIERARIAGIRDRSESASGFASSLSGIGLTRSIAQQAGLGAAGVNPVERAVRESHRTLREIADSVARTGTTA